MAATALLAYLDDLTIVTEAKYLEMAIQSLQAALSKARLVENEAKGTVWTADEQKPDGDRAAAMWDNTADHRGFVLAGCPGTYEDSSEAAPSPMPIGNPVFIAEFLQKRAKVTRTLAERIAALPNHAPPGMPAVQAASCMLRECIPQRSNHLLRVLASSSTEEFTKDVDDAVAEAAVNILDLPNPEQWQRDALFVPAERGGWGLWRLSERRHAARIGGMIAAPASQQEREDIPAMATAAAALTVELDAYETRFGKVATATLNRSKTDLALGGVTGGQSSLQSVASQVTTQHHREAITPWAAKWMDGASSIDADGKEVSPGTSSWIGARPVGPSTTLHDRHMRIAARLRFLVPLCAHGDPACARPTQLATSVDLPWTPWPTTAKCAAEHR